MFILTFKESIFKFNVTWYKTKFTVDIYYVPGFTYNSVYLVKSVKNDI